MMDPLKHDYKILPIEMSVLEPMNLVVVGPGGEPSETADMTFMNETIALQINLLVGGLLVLNNPKSTAIFESQLTF